MLAVHDEDQHVRRARAAGANGYVLKTADTAEIFKTILGVASGDEFFPKKNSCLKHCLH